jgi:protein tyrosine phosphatase (PTP) superfamily phosphohydrolase (DUF442 family)
MQAENTYKVFNWLWTSGHLCAEDIARLPDYRIKHVINLAPPNASLVLPQEAELVSGLGINYFQLPITWSNPELDKVTTFIKLLSGLEGENTWVHCVKNMRVSAFIYLYRRLHLQESDETASFPMKHIWQADDVWANFIAQAVSQPRT